MIFSCTGKVLKRIKGNHLIAEEKEDVSLHNWYVDQIVLDRKKYFLFTNSITLFSFFFYVGTKKEVLNIEQLFIAKLEEQLIRTYGHVPRLIEKAIPEQSTFSFTKTNSRSVLGSMNDFKWNIDGFFMNPNNTSHELSIHYLNIMPMGALKYKSPQEEMKELLLNA